MPCYSSLSANITTLKVTLFDLSDPLNFVVPGTGLFFQEPVDKAPFFNPIIHACAFITLTCQVSHVTGPPIRIRAGSPPLSVWLSDTVSSKAQIQEQDRVELESCQSQLLLGNLIEANELGKSGDDNKEN